jgi:anti-sigma B factor antagonist
VTEHFETQPLNASAGTYELVLKGRIYADVAPQLKGTLSGLADKGMKYLVVDASALEQIDSSGLNVFVHLLKRVRPDGGKVVFFGLNENIRRVFDITKLGTVMGVEEQRADALESLA